MNSWQSSFDDIGRLLNQITFVVVDLETTGASSRLGSGITEIGAVKVRGGEIIGEFQSFINPQESIPAFITVLTGITDAMVINAPTIAEAFPTFLEFLGSADETVIVAHNAPFDLGFLKSAASMHKYQWPKFPVLDTAKLARNVLSKDEVRNCKLSTLSHFFHARTSPTHRALDDARATVDVLHGLFERLGTLGITTLEEVSSFSNRITKAQIAKKHLAANIPAAPGVYIFRDSKNVALYVGTSKNLRNRVRSYFTASETRRRMHEMFALTDHIDTIVCATVLEAQVRELRLISDYQPRFNRRSRNQEKAVWVAINEENFPRLVTLRGAHTLRDQQGWLGPFNGVGDATLAIDAIHTMIALRQCTPKINEKSQKNASPCALFDMQKCGAPCIGAQSATQYFSIVALAQHHLHTDSRELIEHLSTKMRELSLDEKFEEAALVRNQQSAFVRGVSRGQRIRSLTQVPELVTATKQESGLWEFVCIRYGRLVGSAQSVNGIDINRTIESLVMTSEIVTPRDSILPASTYEEVEKLLSYLESPGIRLVSLTGEWSMPIFGAGSTYFKNESMRKDYEADNLWLSSAQRTTN